MIWNQIVPNDRFRIQVERPISATEIIYLTHLYQPLIGPVSVSLYQTLLNEMPAHSYAPQEGIHRWLMSLFMMPLDQLVKAREKLEAVGLLKTVRYDEGSGDRLFEYTLAPPFSPSRFFGDDILSLMLLNRMGKSRYRQLREKFSMKEPSQNVSDKSSRAEELTRRFDEVFQALSPTEMDVRPGSETGVLLQSLPEQLPLPPLDEQQEDEELTLNDEALDWDYLEAMFPKWGKPQSLQITSIRQFLKEMAFVYQLNSQQIARVLQEPSVYDEQDLLDTERMKKICKQWYREQFQAEMPRIAEQQQNKEKKAPEEPVRESENQDEYQVHQQRLAQTSPLKLLQEYQGGGKISAADQKIVEELMEDYLLPSGVVNVLLEYVMFTHDKQLPKSLIYKIAAHWRRAEIKTVAQAQTQAKQLYQKHLNGATSPKQGTKPRNTTKSNRKNTARREQLPAWVKEQLDQEQQEKKPSSSEQRENHREQVDQNDRIATLLKELRNEEK